MSKISAVICELNPLHIGHQYIFDKAKSYGDTVVAVMSGNFVQRGECSVFHKYKRAEMALLCGADLVLELPFPWCAAPAEYFARGAMSVVAAIGADTLVFGSECGDTELLKITAKAATSDEFIRAVEEEYTENVGFAAARERAANNIIPESAPLFSSANDMLALEYIINAEKCGFKGEFCAEKRLSTDGYVSASGIREAIYSFEESRILRAIPAEIRELFTEALSERAYLSKLEMLELYSFRQRQMTGETFDFESGILSRLEKCADMSESGREMLEKASTKKYTDARIRRAALFALLGVTKEQLREYPAFTVVLAANEKGRTLLSELRKKEEFTFITKPSDMLNVKGAQPLAAADRLYTLLFETPKEAGFFIKRSPIIKS